MKKQKTLWRRAMKRKFSINGVSFIYNGTKYIPEDEEPFIESEIRFNGTEVTIEKWGREPGTFDMGTLFYVPTRTEAKFLGLDWPAYVRFQSEGYSCE